MVLDRDAVIFPSGCVFTVIHPAARQGSLLNFLTDIFKQLHHYFILVFQV